MGSSFNSDTLPLFLRHYASACASSRLRTLKYINTAVLLLMSKLSEKWYEKAEAFSMEARDAANKERYDLSCFLVQQACEMILKGFCIRTLGVRPYTYSLSELLEIAFGKQVPEEVSRCAKELEEHYLQARYPDARLMGYSREEAPSALRCMEVITDFVKRSSK